MRSELVVDVQQKDITIALLEDSRLVSLQKESRNVAYAVGDLYFAKVRKLMPGLNAAFMDVGYDKDAFLHYLDLGSQFSTFNKYIETALADRRNVPNISKPAATYMCLTSSKSLISHVIMKNEINAVTVTPID